MNTIDKLDRVSTLETTLVEARKEQLALAAQVIIESISAGEGANLQPLAGSMHSTTFSAHELIFALKDALDTQ